MEHLYFGLNKYYKQLNKREHYTLAIERIIPEPTNYKEKRVLEYPSIGDVIDALVKKEGGDSTEWDAIVTARAAVKTKHPKE